MSKSNMISISKASSKLRLSEYAIRKAIRIGLLPASRNARGHLVVNEDEVAEKAKPSIRIEITGPAGNIVQQINESGRINKKVTEFIFQTQGGARQFRDMLIKSLEQ